MPKKAYFRFYEELNDFLPPQRKKTKFPYEFEGRPSVKDAIESIGVPHTEVDLVLANGESVPFSFHLGDGDTISVYPVFESMDISPVTRLRPKPLRTLKFVLDVHLGKLAKYMRMLGFDTLYETGYDDMDIVAIAGNEKRIILTRHRELLKMKVVTHGYWIRSTNPLKQAAEVIHRFDMISSSKPFYRCLACNGIIMKTDKESVLPCIEAGTKRYYEEFSRCTSCGKIYWKGTHYERMERIIEKLMNDKK